MIIGRSQCGDWIHCLFICSKLTTNENIKRSVINFSTTQWEQGLQIILVLFNNHITKQGLQIAPCFVIWYSNKTSTYTSVINFLTTRQWEQGLQTYNLLITYPLIKICFINLVCVLSTINHSLLINIILVIKHSVSHCVYKLGSFCWFWKGNINIK